MKYFSMFSGIGGFELGIQRVYMDLSLIEKGKIQTKDEEPLSNISIKDGNGWKQYPLCIGYSEIDKYSIQTYEKHFGGHKNYGDATKINPEQLPNFDLLVGGFPCQAFSIAGKRRGFEDTRGTLFFDIARVLKAKQPRMFLLENVKGLLNHDKGKTFTKILQSIDELGYDAEWQVLNSKHFGVPQNRERVFIIGHLRGTSRRKIFPIKSTSQEPNKWASSLQHPGHSGGNYKGMNMVKAVLTPDREEKRQNGRRFKENGEPMFTVTGQDIHGVMISPCLHGFDHGTNGQFNNSLRRKGMIRRLTPIECERLQGFPDNWTAGVSDTQRYKQMGNAVTVNVIEAIVTQITQMPKNE